MGAGDQRLHAPSDELIGTEHCQGRLRPIKGPNMFPCHLGYEARYFGKQ